MALRAIFFPQNLCSEAFLHPTLHTFLFQHVKHGIFSESDLQKTAKYRGFKIGNLDLVQFLSSNFVDRLTLKAIIAPQKELSTKSKVFVFFQMKSRYIFLV